VVTRTRNRAIHPSDPDLQALRELALEAYVGLGSQAEPKLLTLNDYDYQRFGPFLGVSDEGSAAVEICRAALEDPKHTAFKTNDPMVIGLALDAERLVAVGEVAVGPAEYCNIRLDTTGHLLNTTNVGAQVNIRYYKNPSVVIALPGEPHGAVTQAVKNIKHLVQPFLKTPDGNPRPTTVLLRFVGKQQEGWQKQVFIKIRRKIKSSQRYNSAIRQIDLCQIVRKNRPGVLDVKEAIDLAVYCGIKEVALEGSKRTAVERSIIPVPGLLNYFPPGLLQEILDYAFKRGIRVKPLKVVDVETTARNIWMGLSSARHMGLELGKYGLVPLTFEEQKAVICDIQKWFSKWCAAPVHYIDLPALGHDALGQEKVYGEKNAVEGTKRWLELVSNCGVSIVLIDTADKSKEKRLMKRNKKDAKGILNIDEIIEIDRFAHEKDLKVLWAGGLKMKQAYQLSKLGVFGLYVTSDVADKIAVTPDYANDRGLSSQKEPRFGKILKLKTLIEAGFMTKRMSECGKKREANKLNMLARGILRAGNNAFSRKEKILQRHLVKCWRISMKTTTILRSK